MKVSIMSEPEFAFLVTGCDDIQKAREAVLAEYRAEIDYEDAPPDTWFEKRPGRVETGRVFNCKNHDPFGQGLDWYWMTAKPGRGTTRAVVFDSRKQETNE